ncbi:hypothetical protein GUITHDRAFT_115301 [Guillardia theta CCMP2712]|uniref:PH domain-containing protein n=2 Tax=Guillardia theta TaxID=55529 RepID=L1IRJ7_GUITC|nr:hypothetical protein GUITHDRAFT_115301 [Guillardia theta CCMP2712]EKX38524.1 hypothetical protein GUITHDRAFT_115301 [Guillardia theta CCMP2712]|eukprot:XP_005825504.1 hypothetical protein GUITHDRAFT_115301 [Guillardia theta CCMP2712]
MTADNLSEELTSAFLSYSSPRSSPRGMANDDKSSHTDHFSKNPRVPSPTSRPGRASPPRNISPTNSSSRMGSAGASSFTRARSSSLPTTTTRRITSPSSAPRLNTQSRDPGAKGLRRGSESARPEIPWLVLPTPQLPTGSCLTSHRWAGREPCAKPAAKSPLTSLKLYTISESLPAVFVSPSTSPKYSSGAGQTDSKSWKARYGRTVGSRNHSSSKSSSCLSSSLQGHRACKEFQLAYHERRSTGKMYMRGMLDVRSSLADSQVMSVWGKIEDGIAQDSRRRLNLFANDTYTTPIYSIALPSVSVVLVPDKALSFAMHISNESGTESNGVWITAPSSTFRLRWLLALEEAGARIITETFDDEGVDCDNGKMVEQVLALRVSGRTAEALDLEAPYSFPRYLRYFNWQSLFSSFVQMS